jgi:hypothetical protein
VSPGKSVRVRSIPVWDSFKAETGQVESQHHRERTVGEKADEPGKEKQQGIVVEAYEVHSFSSTDRRKATKDQHEKE